MTINPSITNNEESFEWDGIGGQYHPYLMRQQWIYSILDPRRDIDKECGYPRDIIPRQYRFMYDREGVASRVVDIYPDECWAVDPEIYESEGATKTPFEQDWEDLCMDGENNPLHYLHRLDVLSGIGRFGVLLIGTDDGLDMAQPLPGLNPDGSPNGKSSGYNVLYLRAYDESMAFILDYERDISNPRYGRPTFYHLLMANIIPNMMPTEPANVTIVSKIVHWTRVLHAADGRETSEVFGVPRMRKVFNRLCDVRKILGGSGEMFWKGGFPGYSFELSPELTLAGVQVDRDKLERQLERYANGMQRYLAIVGLQAKSLAPQVANPDPTLTAHLNSIAISIGCPLRIFTGSEQAQLASGQDVRTWNRRLTRRQRRYLSPLMVRPFVDRMIAIGRVRPPKSKNYDIHWPDVNMPSAEDQSKIADRQTACMLKYITGGGPQLIAPKEFLQMIMGMQTDQINIIAKAMDNWSKPIVAPAVQAVEAQGEVDAELQTDQQIHDKSMATKVKPTMTGS